MEDGVGMNATEAKRGAGGVYGDARNKPMIDEVDLSQSELRERLASFFQFFQYPPTHNQPNDGY